MTKPRQCLKKQRHDFANKNPYSQTYGFSSSHVQMWKLDHKEVWALKNWCFRNLVLEKTVESTLDSREIKPVNPKGNQPQVIIERMDAEAWSSNTLATWCKDSTRWKTLMLAKIEGRKRRGHQRIRWLDGTIDLMDMSLSKL